MMKRNFRFDLVKVKNKQFFGCVQNVKLFFKNIFLTDLVIVYYIEPFFSLKDQDAFNDFITQDEGEIFKFSRQEIKIDDRIIYFAINNHSNSYVTLNKEDLSKHRADYFFDSSLGFIYKLNASSSFRTKYKKFCMDIYKERFLKDSNLISVRFKEQLKKNKGDFYNINESLVDHIPKEIELNLFPFFQEDEITEMIVKFSHTEEKHNGKVIKFNYYEDRPESFTKDYFITNLNDYRTFLLDFYGEKGIYCKFTNFDENFLKNYKTKEELMYIDMVLGNKFVSEGYPPAGEYPFFSIYNYPGWLIVKKIVEKLTSLKKP